MSKKALGKGLDALLFSNEIKQSAEQTEDTALSDPDVQTQIQEISLEKIKPNPHQPRKEFREDALQELAESIKTRGVIQPVLAEQSGEEYLLIAGERRYRAAQLAGLETIPVIVKELTENEKLEIALIENIQRENLTPIEEAKAYAELMQATNCNQEDVAKRVGKNRSTVANSLRLLKLPEKMQAALQGSEFTPGHARAVLSVVNPAHREMLFNSIVKNGLSVREAEQEAAQFNTGSSSVQGAKTSSDKKQFRKKPEILDMEQKFLDVFGTKVDINGSLDKGKIVIEYFSMDDLERIYEIVAPDTGR